MFVAIQCRTNLPVERLVAFQGAQAKAKESQAAVKALEALVAAYSSQLVPTGATAGDSGDAGGEAEAASEGVADHMKTGHPGVVSICEGGAAVCRVNLHADPDASPAWAEASGQAVRALLARRGGVIGWLRAAPGTAPAGALPSHEPASTGSESSALAPVFNTTAASKEKSPLVLSAQIQQLDEAKLKTLTLKADTVSSLLCNSVLCYRC